MSSSSTPSEWDRWNGDPGARWVAEQEHLDRALEVFGRAVLERVPPSPGGHVIDVGSGCGATSLALAESVGPTGTVLGVDISALMLARARERVRERALTNVRFEQADAETFSFAPQADLVFSRFGVMFFQNPTVAFRNLATALRPGGKLAFVCWRELRENPWLYVPFEAANTVIHADPVPADPGAPGPFAFSDRSHVERILSAAGFSDIVIDRFDHAVLFGANADEAAFLATRTGPSSRLIAAAPEPLRDAARGAMRAAFEPHATRDGVALPGSAWIVVAS
jgi:SAM-dependent methyltransferase